jgi:YbbR domain-containing protein
VLSKVIRFFTQNTGLKLAALGLAILLWLAVTANEPQRAAFRNIPIQVDLQDPDWRLDQPPEPSSVTVTVQGPRGELVDLSGDPPRIVLPVERVNDTVESQVVSLQWVHLPAAMRDTRVLALRPDTIRLHYQRLDSKTLPVQVRTRGDLPDGYALALPINTNPATVEVRGVAAALAILDSVPLQPVDLTGIRSTTNVPTAIDTRGLDGLTFSPDEVNVVLRVLPADSQPGLQPDSAQRRAPF